MGFCPARSAFARKLAPATATLGYDPARFSIVEMRKIGQWRFTLPTHGRARTRSARQHEEEAAASECHASNFRNAVQDGLSLVSQLPARREIQCAPTPPSTRQIRATVADFNACGEGSSPSKLTQGA